PGQPQRWGGWIHGETNRRDEANRNRFRRDWFNRSPSAEQETGGSRARDEGDPDRNPGTQQVAQRAVGGEVESLRPIDLGGLQHGATMRLARKNRPGKPIQVDRL